MLGAICKKRTAKGGKSSIEKCNYKKSVSECNKLQSLNKNVVRRNIIFLSKQEYYNVRIEHGEIINESVIPKGDDAIDDV